MIFCWSLQGASALTTSDLERIGVTEVCVVLSDLLIKPGLDVLQRIGLQAYLNWPGKIWIETSVLSKAKEGILECRSPYDGSKHVLSLAAIETWLENLSDPIKQVQDPSIILPTQELLATTAAGKILSRGKEICLSKLNDSTEVRSILSDQKGACGCEACETLLTIPYLQHLYEQVPSLAYRFILQHNLFQMRL